MAEVTTDYELELSRAVIGGCINKTKEILSLNSVKLNDERYFDYSLVIKALLYYRIDQAKLLIEKGCRVYKNSKTDKEGTVLHAAIQTIRDTDFIATLLTKGASPDILTLDAYKKTPFHLAIDKGQCSIIELFLSHFDAKIFDERYLLHYAIETDNIAVVSLLIAKGLSLLKKNENNLTPFCIALENKNYKILDCLLAHHKVKNIKPNDRDDIAPAFIAIVHGNLKALKEFVHSGLSINIPVTLSADTWPCLKDWLSECGSTLLHFAVKYIKLNVVELLLQKGADILVTNKNGLSPLHVAFEIKERGFWKTWQDFDDMNSIIDLILKANLEVKDNPINKHGLSHFHIACSRDEPTVVEHFLRLDAPIDQPVSPECHRYKKYSPLHFAAKFRCKKTVKLLLKSGADVKQRDFKGMTALHIAAKESCLDVVSLLLQSGAEIASVDRDGNTPIHWAFEEKNYRVIDLLLSVANVAKSNPTNSKGLSHFHIACTRNNVNVVKSFIENGVSLDTCVPVQSDKDDDSVDADWSGYSPLHFAVSHNRVKIVSLLLDRSSNVGINDNKGVTPFHLACQYTCEMFAEFIENILRNLSKHKKITQLSQSLTDIAKVSEKYTKFSGSIPSYNYGYTQKIDWSANRKDYLKILNLLLDYGSDVNCIDNKGNAPVFHACAAVLKVKSKLKNNLGCSEGLWADVIELLTEELYGRRKWIVNDLLKLDVNLDECYKNGSILHYLISNEDEQSEEMIKLFLKNGASVNVTNDEMLTPLLQATMRGKNNLIRVLLDYGANVDCVDPKDNSTPLLIAISLPSSLLNWKIVQILLDKGANPNARQSNGRTALHNVALIRNTAHIDASVSALVKAGADINSRDSEGLTALHCACEVKYYHLLEALLMNGADVSIEDNNGSSVCCYLYEKYLINLSIRYVGMNLSQIIRVLQKHIIRMNVIGLPVSAKALSSSSKFDDFLPLSDEEKVKLIEKCQSEVQLFRDTRIHDSCTLFDVMFKNENALSHLVKFSTFEAFCVEKSKMIKNSYPQYGYLVALKYQAGVDRGYLLPTAKLLLDDLAGMHLPDICSENICKYFKNGELKESTYILRGLLDLKVENLDDVQWRGSRTNKRQKIN